MPWGRSSERREKSIKLARALVAQPVLAVVVIL
jgi:hypothetical protein